MLNWFYYSSDTAEMFLDLMESSKTWGIPSLFLAGPTDRKHLRTYWREEVVNHLASLYGYGQKINVFIPEFASHDDRRKHKDGDFLSYADITTWEQTRLFHPDVHVLFWIPRSERLPAFTTNVEFGLLMGMGQRHRIHVGSPDAAIHMRYLQRVFTYNLDGTPTGRKWHNTIPSVLQEVTNVWRNNGDFTPASNVYRL